MKQSKKNTQARINPDSRATLWFTVVLITLLGLCSFMVSFNGLHDVASWVGLPDWMRWTVPIFIDIAILAYSMAAVIHKSRGETVITTWVTLGVFTLISVVANAAHALSAGEGETAVQRWIGAAIAAAAPVAVFAATEELSRLAFSQRALAAAAAEATVPNGTVAAPVLVSTSADSLDSSRSVEASAQRPAESALEPTTAEETKPALATASDDAPDAHADVLKALSSVEDEPDNDDPTPGNLSLVVTSATNPEDEELAAWVVEQIRQGKKITGADAGRFLNKTARTGLNRVNKLRESQPELFVGEVA